MGTDMIKYLCDVCNGDAFHQSVLNCVVEKRIDDQCLNLAKIAGVVQFRDLVLNGKTIYHICKNCLCELIKSTPI